MQSLLTDPWFYAAAVPAVILVGMSKGGLGGAGLVGVPLLSLVVPPLQAAAILMPILIVMDVVSLWSWRGARDPVTLRLMLPGALAGVALGWLTAAIVTAGAVRLIVGGMSLAFFLRWLTQRKNTGKPATVHEPVRATFWGGVSGFTSFVAHAGGPPYQVYTLPLKQAPSLYVGTNVVFFAIVNVLKLVPYFALGQFDKSNMVAAAVLMPLAPLATLAGAWTVRRMRAEVFYPFMYVMIFVVSLKLIWDGVFDFWP